jgi:hypothetical protein
MMIAEPPPETTLEHLAATWRARTEQLAKDQTVQVRQIEDHRDFLGRWQKRLQEWEALMTAHETAIAERSQNG